MLTDNNVSDRLINGSFSTAKHLHMRSKPLRSTKYVKFDEPKARNSLKNRRFCGELNECVQNKDVSMKERQKYCYC